MRLSRQTALIVIAGGIVIATGSYLWLRPRHIVGIHHATRWYQISVRRIGGAPRADGKIITWWSTGERQLVGTCKDSPILEPQDIDDHGKPSFIIGVPSLMFSEHHRRILGDSYRLDGRVTTWHSNGKRWFQGKCENGARTGWWTLWDGHGVKREQGMYARGLPTGRWYQWSSEGLLLGTNALHSGSGTFTLWHSNGQVFQICQLREGREHGVSRIWSEEGSLLIEVHMGEGKKHGPDFRWYRSGKRAWQREYQRGRPAGQWRSWQEDGTLRSEGVCSNGQLWAGSFMSSGSGEICVYSNGVLVGRESMLPTELIP